MLGDGASSASIHSPISKPIRSHMIDSAHHLQHTESHDSS